MTRRLELLGGRRGPRPSDESGGAVTQLEERLVDLLAAAPRDAVGRPRADREAVYRGRADGVSGRPYCPTCGSEKPGIRFVRAPSSTEASAT